MEEVSSGVRAIQAASTADTAFVLPLEQGPEDEAVTVESFAAFAEVYGSGGAPVRLFFENGGRRAYVVRTADPADTAPAALDTIPADGPGLLCAPGLADVGGPAYTDGYRAALDWCRPRRTFLLADPPHDAVDGGPAEVARWAGIHRSPNAAAYHPRLEVPKAGVFPASGAVAGIYARNDIARGVWKAPAGTEAKVQGGDAAERLTDDQAAELNEAGVNSLRVFPRRGTLVWGARTLAGNDNEWRYVNVRRFYLFMERSIHQGTKWVVFEPNDEPLWASVQRSVEHFLHRAYLDGALMGAKPEEAYFVRCDRSTMTEADIAEGRLVFVVGFAPLRPAEFVFFRVEHQVEKPA